MSDFQDLKKSARFNAVDGDVIVKSIDNVLFSIHRKNLDVTTGAFPPADVTTPSNSIALSESSATLELLFQYIYPMPQPDVPSMPFGRLAPLAEAVEKYHVFPAMLVCKISMRVFLPGHVGEVVDYAVRHGYSDIMDDAVPLLLAIPLKEALALLPPVLVVPWALYHSVWDQALSSARSFLTISELEKLRNTHGPAPTQCNCYVDETICNVLMALNGVGSLQNLASVMMPSAKSCDNVISCLNRWRGAAEMEINGIKPFTTYVFSESIRAELSRVFEA